MVLGGYMDKQIGAAQNNFQLHFQLGLQQHQLLGQELLLLKIQLEIQLLGLHQP